MQELYYSYEFNISGTRSLNMYNTGTTPELNSDDIKKLSEILTHLQTMATAFDDIQYNRNHSRCVRLTAAQYRIMYYIQHPNTSLKQALKDIKEFWNSTDGDYNMNIYIAKSWFIIILFAQFLLSITFYFIACSLLVSDCIYVSFYFIILYMYCIGITKDFLLLLYSTSIITFRTQEHHYM